MKKKVKFVKIENVKRCKRITSHLCELQIDNSDKQSALSGCVYYILFNSTTRDSSTLHQPRSVQQEIICSTLNTSHNSMRESQYHEVASSMIASYRNPDMMKIVLPNVPKLLKNSYQSYTAHHVRQLNSSLVFAEQSSFFMFMCMYMCMCMYICMYMCV